MDKKIFKILVVGEKKTGKTQIIQAFNQYIPLNVSQVSYKTLNTQCETKSTS
jgi:signal recognition particle receptor subunit beta